MSFAAARRPLLLGRAALLLLSLPLVPSASYAQKGQLPSADPDNPQASNLGQGQDQPGARAAWFLRGRTVHGQSAAALLRHAHQQKLRIRQATQERLLQQAAQQATGAGSSGTTAPSGGILPMTVPQPSSPWVNLGPAPITGLGRFGDAVGRITSIAVDQTDSTGNTVYVAGAYGGVWKSTNAANADPTLVTWTPIYDTDPAAVTLAAGAVSIEPTNSSVILVGTGEPNNALDSYYGMGILRSTNGGASWTLITSATGGQPFSGMGVSKFAWKPDGSVVVAGLSNSTNLGPGAGGGFQGIYYSSDGGATWTRATNATTGDLVFGSVSDVVYVGSTINKFFAALKKQGIYSSSDGITWTRLANQPVSFTTNCSNGSAPSCDMLRAALAVKPGAADMYAWVVASNGTTNKGMGKTINGGTTAWSALVTTGITSCGDAAGGCGTGQGFYDLVLAAVPNGTNTDLYAGAVNLFKCASSNSTTCTTWLNLTHVYGSCSASNVSIHPDQHAIDFLQSNTNIVYFGNDGGAYRTLTAKTGMGVSSCTTATHNAFQDLNTSTLGSLSQFISISHHPTDDSVILGGTQDNGSPAIASGQASPPLNPPLWFEANGGDGGYNEIDQTNPNNWYTANTDVSIQKCTTGTNCIETDFFTNVVTNTTLTNDHGDFYTPYILDPANQAKLLVGTCRVWRVNNDGTGATKLSNKLVAGTTTACSSSEASYVYALAAGGPTTSNGSQVIYAGTSDGKIFVTTSADTGAASWVDRTASINPNGYVLSKVGIDATDATGQTAYVTLMGFTGGGGHVFKTTNAGVGWTDISAGLPDAPADSVVVDPNDHTIVYVGTDVGVFATNDNGASWSEYGTGLPNVATVALRTFNSGGTKKLRVGTHGRGVWETDLAVSSDYSINISNPTVTVYPGVTGTFDGTLTAIGGYSSPVNLSCANGITGAPASCTPSPTSQTPTGGGAVFSVAAHDLTPSDYNFDVKGVGTDSGTITHETPVTLKVIDFQLGAGTNFSVPAGNSGQTTLALTVSSSWPVGRGVNSSCNIPSPPTGMLCSVAPSSLSANGNFTLTVSTTGATPVGSYNVTATATDSADPSQQRSNVVQVTVTAAVPVAVSVTPSSGSGATQTFSFLYSDAAGSSSIGATEQLINGTLDYANGCVTHYDAASNSLFLRNDAGSAWLVPMTLGQAGTLQNSQCSINLGSSSAVGASTNLTVTLAIAFKPAFGGAKTVYMWARDTSFVNTGWQMKGTWTVPTVTLAAVLVAPSSGSGASQTFSFQYYDVAGFTSIGATQQLFNATLDYANSCTTNYDRASNSLFLRNDAGSAWLSPMTLGQPGTLQNSQCSIDLGNSSAVGSNTDLTVNLAIAFKPAFGGAKAIYMWVRDTSFVNSGWQTSGTWSVPAATLSAVSVTPSSGSGSSQTFSFLYSDTAGFTSIGATQQLFNATLDYANSCATNYDRPSNQLFLRNDAGSAWLTPMTLGQAGTLQNNQCSIDLGSSSAVGSSTDLTVNLAISFKPAFTGAKTTYMWVRDTNYVNIGWQTKGSWTVP